MAAPFARGPRLAPKDSTKWTSARRRSTRWPGLGADQVVDGRFKLAGGDGKRQSLLLLKGREDADHGRDAIDVRQDRRARVAEIRQALDRQQPIVFAPIGAAVPLLGR